MNVLIIEDEESAYKKLASILGSIDNSITLVSWIQSVEQSIAWLQSNQEPDLIFLDIQLSDDISFKIFESVEINCPIVFTTAFDEYAVKAFEVNSIDYVLKPITRQQIEKSITKYKSSKQYNSSIYQTLLEDLKSLSTTQQFKERFLVNQADELIVLKTKEIAYFYIDKETQVVLKNGKKYPLNFSLEKLENVLNLGRFHRINRQFIVSIDSISKITLWFKGKLKIELSPKFSENVFISREKTTDFKKWMER